MSCRWDLYCIDCGERCGFTNLNHGEQVLADLWAGREGIAALYAVKAGYMSVELKISNDHYVNIEFFAKHRDHNVRRLSEYGQFDGDCREWAACPTCKHHKACALAEGHAGNCVPRLT